MKIDHFLPPERWIKGDHKSIDDIILVFNFFVTIFIFQIHFFILDFIL